MKLVLKKQACTTVELWFTLEVLLLIELAIITKIIVTMMIHSNYCKLKISMKWILKKKQINI